MKPAIFFFSGFLFATSLFCQQQCDSTNLQADKDQLRMFWIALKESVNRKDKEKLSELVSFPFNCDYCIVDSAKGINKPYIKVTKTSFDKSQYQIFFAERLVTEINRRSFPADDSIFQSYYNTISKKCSYSFGYTVRDETSQHPGMQHFFDIQKVNGRFKISSAWTLP